MTARVCVMMATLNGASYLAEQLASLTAQRHPGWYLIASDDGSSDGTLAMLETFQRDLGAGRVSILDGPGRGATANFHSLIHACPPGDDFGAFCDQDDIWLPEKLERAVSALSGITGPALFCCREEIIDADGRTLGLSRRPSRALGLSHALAENTLPGHTMVLNRAAIQVLKDAGPAGGYYDWWAFQVIAAAGGKIVFDAVPGVRYRQHAGNLVGDGRTRGGRWLRVLLGDHAASLRAQAQTLATSPALGIHERNRVNALLSLKDKPFWRRPGAIRHIGIYRQSRLEDLVLKVLMLAGRI